MDFSKHRLRRNKHHRAVRSLIGNDVFLADVIHVFFDVRLELALRLLETAPGARTTLQSPLRWSEDASWKLDYNNIAQMSAEELARRRAEFDKQKEIARGNRAA